VIIKELVELSSVLVAIQNPTSKLAHDFCFGSHFLGGESLLLLRGSHFFCG
jgi:hypothetical protein